MDVTNVSSADGEELDHPVQVGSPLASEDAESGFDGTTVTAAEVTFREGERINTARPFTRKALVLVRSSL